MMALALLVDTALAAPIAAPVTNPLAGPDVAPMHAAVAACDRDAMARLNHAEPHRRAEFALAVYAEQRAVAAERAALPVTPAAIAASGKASSSAATPLRASPAELAHASLDARQRRLDDARATEQAWRTAVDELRADFLANCERKHD